MSEDRAGQLDLPGAGTELGECGGHGGGQRVRVAGRRRRPEHPAQVVRGEQVLGRQLVLLGQDGEPLSRRREPAGRDRVALGPGPGERGAVRPR